MRESEIRPQDLFNKYLELSQKDGLQMDANLFVKRPCPGCDANDSCLQFTKYSFNYERCLNCGSLYCNPRPNDEQLGALYKNSESSQFWSKVFFPAVAEARKEKLFRPKAKEIREVFKSKVPDSAKIIDIGAGHGLLLDELKNEWPQASFFAIEPDLNSAEVLKKKGYQTFVKHAQDMNASDGKFDLAVSFEVIEHVGDLHKFLSSIADLIAQNGCALFTGLGYEGFDILSLQAESKSVSPPHHLNFLSMKGFEMALKRAGFTKTEIWTPGKLDVNITSQGSVIPEFFRVLEDRGQEAIKELQNFLTKWKLSSHVWAVGYK